MHQLTKNIAQQVFDLLTPQQYMLNPQLHAWFSAAEVQEKFKDSRAARR